MRWILDPTKHFSDAKTERLTAALGILPHLFNEAEATVGGTDARYLYDAAVALYGFGDYAEAFQGGTVDAAGIYTSQFEDDPELYPLAMGITGEGVDVFIYQYAMVSVVDKGTTIITRMD